MSALLKAFLETKRVPGLVPPPPPVEASSDLYIRNFFAQKSLSGPAEDADDEDDVADELEDAGNEETEEDKQEDDKEDDKEDDEDDEERNSKRRRVAEEGTKAADVKEQENALKIKLMNLPFKMSLKTLKKTIRDRKVDSSNLVLDFDKVSKLPAGTAVLTLSSTAEVEACFDKLKGLELMGRPLRLLGSSSAPRPNNSRYFVRGTEAGITKKCAKCGQLGHIMRECTFPPLPSPCHLCAGKDHEAADCPNITCFRCGRFGHHSRNCTGRRDQTLNNGVAELCSTCGSSSHTATRCRAPRAVESMRPLDEEAVCCMCCGEYGHALCKVPRGLEGLLSVPSPKAKSKSKAAKAASVSPSKKKPSKVHCPSCGSGGHHVDWTLPGQPLCQVPRAEAYARLPVLLQDIDDLPSKPAKRMQYYQSIAQESGGCFHLFPCLNDARGLNGGGGGRSNPQHIRFSDSREIEFTRGGGGDRGRDRDRDRDRGRGQNRGRDSGGGMNDRSRSRDGRGSQQHQQQQQYPQAQYQQFQYQQHQQYQQYQQHQHHFYQQQYQQQQQHQQQQQQYRGGKFSQQKQSHGHGHGQGYGGHGGSNKRKR